MQHRYTAVALLALLSISACSSESQAPQFPNGALPNGTAQVTVNGAGAGRTRDVECKILGKRLTEIKIGLADNAVTALVDADKLKAIAFNDVGGFTGSYWQDLQGSARLDMVDQTYALTGTAVGFNTENPYIRYPNRFDVKVAC